MIDNQRRLLGIGLIIGGLLVGGIIVWLASIYAGDGTTPPVVAIVMGIAGLTLFTVPQIGLGIYILRSFANGED